MPKFILIILLLTAIAVQAQQTSAPKGGDDSPAAAGAVACSLIADLTGQLRPIPDDFIGLSFESSQLLAKQDGWHEFSAENRPLQTLLRTLGIRSLRFGGNLADSPTSPDPLTADIDPMFELARSLDAQVIYTLRFSQGGNRRPFLAADPAKGAQLSRHITDNYSDCLAAFTIGNEPDMYFRHLEERTSREKKLKLSKAQLDRNAYLNYADAWRKFANAIVTTNPRARFNGPSSTGRPIWAKWFIQDFSNNDRIAFFSNHYYPGGSAKDGTAHEQLASMLSSEWHERYSKYLAGNGFTATGKRPFRIEECNSFYYGGAPGVSDAFGSALWALDFAHWFAARGCAGINFHASTASRHGDEFLFYTPFSRNSTHSARAPLDSSDSGYFTHPVGYAALMFKLGGNGRSVPLDVKVAGFNLTAHAVAGRDGNLYVTLINKEYDAAARNAPVRFSIKGGTLKGTGECLTLIGPSNEVRAKSGITLGGASVTESGTWTGKWDALPATATGEEGAILVNVPPASAMLLKFPLQVSKKSH
ncbi:MAG: glycosyl hydrolase family protein [Akkermansiaceae bacterium]